MQRKLAIRKKWIFGLSCLVAFATLSNMAIADQGIRAVSFGFQGKVRLGHWMPVSIVMENEKLAESISILEITCADGDDVPVTYRSEVIRNPEIPTLVQGCFRLGRMHNQISIRLFDRNNEPIGDYSTSVSGSSDQVQVLPATTRMILVVGKTVDFFSQVASADSVQEGSEISVITDMPITDLPCDWNSYRGLYTVVLAADRPELIERLSKAQIDAMTHWVRNGGRLLFWTSPETSQEFLDGGRLAKFAEFRSAQASQLKSMSRLETFAQSTVPILKQNDETIRFVDVAGEIDPIVDQDGKIVIGRYCLGFGLVTFVGIPLGETQMRDWKTTPSLIEKLILSSANVGSSEKIVGNSQIIDNGYRDLAGQLRVPLEKFSGVGLVPFTAIALLIATFLLVVGPGDFFLLRYFGRRMHWTWLTFPLIATAFCGLAYWINHASKSDQTILNQIEFVDIDAASNTARGISWVGIYSPITNKVNVELQVNHPIVSQVQDEEISWMGQPGSGLGGMQTKTPSMVLVEGYSNLRARSNDIDCITLENFPNSVASAKTLAGNWHASLKLPIKSNLTRSKRFDRIEGEVTNPFDCVLTNPRVFYEDSVFFVERNLEPLGSMDLFNEAKELSAKYFITGSTANRDRDGSQTSRWNSTSTNLLKIGELLMFHDLAGGQAYSGLSNRYFEGLEFSDHLLKNRAIFVGEVPQSFAKIYLNGSELDEKRKTQTLIVRIVLPVKIEETNN